MTMTLYRATVERFEQTLGALDGLMTKGLEHCQATGSDPQQAVEHRLVDDMAPLHFQIVSCAHHSLGALKGVDAGEFSPPPQMSLDYAGLQTLIADTREALAGYNDEQIAELAGRKLNFKAGELVIPFIGEDFLLSFSLPNFYFHAATAYDIFRVRGVTLAKKDFLGRLQIDR